jgi:PEP-CTERM motif
MKHLLSTLTMLLATSTGAHAAIVNHPDVNGVRTFQDTITGRVWMDLDSFRDSAGNLLPGYPDSDAMRATALAAGFVIAREADVQQLTAGLPLAAGNSVLFSSYASDMATAFGAFWLPGEGDWLAGWMLNDTPTDWVYIRSAHINNSQWQTTSAGGQNTNVQAAPGIGLWAFYSPSASGPIEVPEPSSLVLAGLALAAAAGVRRSKQR